MSEKTMSTRRYATMILASFYSQSPKQMRRLLRSNNSTAGFLIRRTQLTIFQVKALPLTQIRKEVLGE